MKEGESEGEDVAALGRALASCDLGGDVPDGAANGARRRERGVTEVGEAEINEPGVRRIFADEQVVGAHVAMNDVEEPLRVGGFVDGRERAKGGLGYAGDGSASLARAAYGDGGQRRHRELLHHEPRALAVFARVQEPRRTPPCESAEHASLDVELRARQWVGSKPWDEALADRDHSPRGIVHRHCLRRRTLREVTGNKVVANGEGHSRMVALYAVRGSRERPPMPFLDLISRAAQPPKGATCMGRRSAIVLATTLSVMAGCSSSSSSGSPSQVFVPGFEAGPSPALDGGTMIPVDGGHTVGMPDGGIPSQPDATTPPDTGTITPTVDSGGPVVVPSSGIVITVIPDNTNIAQGLLTAITNATTAVHMEMYLLTNATYIAELIKLKGQGVDVKVVLNQTFPSGTAAAQTNGTTASGSYATLKAGGVDVIWAPADYVSGESGYTHEKTVIIDPGGTAEQAWIMTMNLDTDAPKDNREYLAQDTNAADITEAEAIFEADYAGTSITPTGDLVVAPAPPNNCATVLLDLINSATTSIDMEAEEIDESGTATETKVFAALVAQAKAHVTVRLVLEDSTETPQATAVADLIAAGGEVRGYAYGGSGLDIHAKALVADGARAYVGSENFTGGSLGYNRELGVYFEEASEVSKVDSTIIADFNAGSTYSSQ
jgi:phosphatidylserine/phosphatidylglycerophosphate/cardiolipin synthase-like enzyme